MITGSHFIIGTAGHIDHGKTCLIKALTGIDTDRLKEEKERGISIDLGFAYLDLPDGTRVGIVDVPGHERFIKNMLAGATGIDLVLFVVAADDGVMPQTKEHLEIMHLLRVIRGIFVITKIDAVAKGRIDEVRGWIKDLIKDTSLKGSQIIQVSSMTGEGIEELKRAIATEVKKITPKPEGGFFRLPIDRSFSIKGFGTVVTGTIASGRVKKGEEVLILPGRVKTRVRGIQSHYQTMDEATIGQRTAINLAGISHNSIKRGDVLASLELTEGVTQALVSFEPLTPLKNRARLKLHHLTNETIAVVVFTGINEVKVGERAYGRIRTHQPLVMMRGDRFILRDPAVNKTVGGGRVLLPLGLVLNPESGSGQAIKPSTLTPEVYQILEGDNLTQILVSLLSMIDFLDLQSIRVCLNLSREDLVSILGRIEEVVVFNDYAVLKARVDEWKGKVIQVLTTYHQERPGEIGVEDGYLYKAVGLKMPRSILHGLLDGLIKEGKVSRRDNLFHLSSHRPMVKGVDKEIEDGVLGLFAGRGFAPLREGEVYQAIPSYKRGDVERVFDGLVKRGILVKVTGDSFLSSETLEKARAQLVNLVRKRGRVKVAEFRDALGCGRKLAIEILEYFDKERFTLRQGEFRTIRGNRPLRVI